MPADNVLDLLDRAIAAARAAVSGATTTPGGSPTPCTRWDLATLVRHLADSAATIDRVLRGLPDGPPPPAGCAAAAAMLTQLAGTAGALRIHDHPDRALVALVGSYELALHAWDVGQSTEHGPALDPDLITALLINAPEVSVGTRRAGLFESEQPAGDASDPELRLLARFGRSRSWRRPVIAR